MERMNLRQARLALLLYPVFAALSVGSCGPTVEAPTEDETTAWAYPMSPPAPSPPPAVDGISRLRIPGAQVTFTAPQLKDRFSAPDWFPNSHRPTPAIVAKGRKPDVMACGFCHLPTGDGRPENATLAGLPRAYIVEQMLAFRSGARRSSVTGRTPTDLMYQSAKAATDAEISTAADYFSGLAHHAFTAVVETDRVPKTRTDSWLYSRDPRGGIEPIGTRIIEIPVDFERFERRDPGARYIAYVPPGSIARGAELARTWGGAGQQACSSCHGADLRGVGNVPPLAGRSPTYVVRQLNDFRTGSRHESTAAPMKQVVAAMRNGDMIALASYLGSLNP